MINIFANVEEWFIPYFKKIWPDSLFISQLSPLSIMDIDDDEFTLFLGSNCLLGFTEVGSLLDHLLITIGQKKIKKLFFFSSYSVYMPSTLPFSENDLVSPKNFIGAKSANIENSICYFSQKFEIPVVILRVFNTYGPLQGSNYIIPHILEAFLNNTSINVGNVKNIRDFLYIDDFIDLVQILYESKSQDIQIYNIGSGKEISIQKIIEIAQNVLGIRKKVIFDAYKLRAEYDYDYAVANISKLKQLFNWEPKISLDMGIKLTYQWIIGKRS